MSQGLSNLPCILRSYLVVDHYPDCVLPTRISSYLLVVPLRSASSAAYGARFSGFDYIFSLAWPRPHESVSTLCNKIFTFLVCVRYTENVCPIFDLSFMPKKYWLSPTPFDVIGLDSMQSPHRPAKWSQTISASAVIKSNSESVSYDSEVTQEFTQNVCSPPLSSVCKQHAGLQLTRQHVGSPVNASVFWTVAIPTWSQNIKWRGYFKCQMHGDVGKLKMQPQVCKAIPRAAPSVEVLWPKCNAPEIAKPFKASTLQGFFFIATTDGLR